MLTSAPYIQLIPLFISPVSAGFPSPASDFIESHLDLNEFLVKHPSSTFFVRVSGESMKNAGIFDGDILVVDKSLSPRTGSIIIAVVNGNFTVKRFSKTKDGITLFPDNEKYLPLKITDGMEFEVWGVVTNVIHKV